MTFKKAQGIPINVIIIAAVALLVLIILIAIFGGRINIFTKSYDDTTVTETERVCSAQGGYCSTESCTDITPPSGGWIDCSILQRCCQR